jgi:hypothetical protein
VKICLNIRKKIMPWYDKFIEKLKDPPRGHVSDTHAQFFLNLEL